MTERGPAFDPRTALIVVDVQNDFADPRGSLYVHGGEQIVPRVNDLVRQARSAGALVVYTQDWHPERTPHFREDGGPWPRHCVRGTWGAEHHPGLAFDGPVVRTGTGGEDGYSGFGERDPRTGATHATELEGLLRDRGVERVVVVGLATDWCVKETALDAARLGFETSVVLDATRPVEPETGARATSAMRASGVAVL